MPAAMLPENPCQTDLELSWLGDKGALHLQGKLFWGGGAKLKDPRHLNPSKLQQVNAQQPMSHR